MKYLLLIDIISRYHNLKPDDKSLYLATFLCLFGRYQFVRLSFRAASAGDMFQRKRDELFSSISNVFGISDDILITGCDEHSRGHDDPLANILWILRVLSKTG